MLLFLMRIFFAVFIDKIDMILKSRKTFKHIIGAYGSLAVKSKGHKTLINTKGIPYALTYGVTNIK